MLRIDKMKSFTAVLFLLVGFVGVFSEGSQWIDFRLASERTFPLQRNVRTTPTCTEPGRVCDDTCKQIWVCSNNSGTLIPVLLQTCSGDDTCNNGICSATPTPECAGWCTCQNHFFCQAEGVFPDPTTCKRYHYCIKDDKGDYIDYLRICPQHYGFHPGTTYCSKILTNKDCEEYPVPICTQPGQTGALKDNKSMYYVCVIYQNTETLLYPNLFICPYGKSYDETTIGCYY